MGSKLSRYCDGVIEAGWLIAVVATPLFFNIHSSRVFEPDKLTLLRSLAVFMMVAWLIKFIDQQGWRSLRRQPLGWLSPRSSSSIWRIPFLIPILLLMLAAWWGLVLFERQLAIWLLHVDIPPISHDTTSGQSVWEQLKAHLSNPLTWKGLAYLFARFPLGIFSFVVAFTLIALTGALVFAPLTYTDPESQMYVFSWQIDTLNEAVICSILGLCVGLISMHVMNCLAFVSGRFAILMLGTTRDRRLITE